MFRHAQTWAWWSNMSFKHEQDRLQSGSRVVSNHWQHLCCWCWDGEGRVLSPNINGLLKSSLPKLSGVSTIAISRCRGCQHFHTRHPSSPARPEKCQEKMQESSVLSILNERLTQPTSFRQTKGRNAAECWTQILVLMGMERVNPLKKILKKM